MCFEFSQITRTTPFLLITLHLLQIFLTDGLTFIDFPVKRLIYYHYNIFKSSFNLIKTKTSEFVQKQHLAPEHRRSQKVHFLIDNIQWLAQYFFQTVQAAQQ